MYAKCLAHEAWSYQEVREHWDELFLRSWVNQGAKRTLYQEASLSSILSPKELLKELPKEGLLQEEGIVLFSGTIATRAGLVYGDSYGLELEDPVLKRKIQHHYRVKILPQYA